MLAGISLLLAFQVITGLFSMNLYRRNQFEDTGEIKAIRGEGGEFAINKLTFFLLSFFFEE